MSHKRKNKKNGDILEDPYPDMNDEFAYIAGYTGWGFPYGVTWKEMGIDQDLPFEEKVKLLEKQDFNKMPECKQPEDSNDDEFPF